MVVADRVSELRLRTISAIKRATGCAHSFYPSFGSFCSKQIEENLRIITNHANSFSRGTAAGSTNNKFVQYSPPTDKYTDSPYLSLHISHSNGWENTFQCQYIFFSDLFHLFPNLGRVVRKPIIINPGLKRNQGCDFPYIKVLLLLMVNMWR